MSSSTSSWKAGGGERRGRAPVPSRRRSWLGPRHGPSSTVDAEDEAGRGDAGSGRHHDVLETRDLVHGRGPDLADPFGDAVGAVDVGLTELPAVGVGGQET